MNFKETSEFSKEIKKLSKSYCSIDQDFFEFKKVVAVLHQIEMNHIFQSNSFTKLSVSQTHTVVKARFDCASLGNKQLLRIIVIVKNDGSEALFVELYAKNSKSREDSTRIHKYLKK